MKKILTILSVTLICGTSCKKANAPTDPVYEKEIVNDNHTCASAEILADELQKDPKRAKYLDDLEEKIKTYKGRGTMNQRGSGKLYVPVVIHVVLTDPAVITDAAILYQQQVLNEDFNKANSELASTSVYLAGYQHSKVANCQIEFYITNVVRVATTVMEFPHHSDSMKFSALGGSDAVNAATKLNIWVCNTPGGLSWARFPGGSNVLTDGIVNDYEFFGPSTPERPNHKGRTATHEVGHWLNLRHIWGDAACGNDFVNDTPDHNGANYYCPAQGLKSTCRGKPLMMWMNQMDYSYGVCKYMFTSGQKQRMDATIDNARSGYFSLSKIYPGYF
jgi:hypothetical protein